MPAAPQHTQDSSPRVSVVIRSYCRLNALADLLERVLDQDHHSFEVVVVEQTPEPTDQERDRLAPLVADPRLRLLERPPLGGPAARNEGVRAARGELVILIDDDDLPLDRHWISAHERHYDDPLLVGLTARHVRAPGERCPYPPLGWFRHRCMSYSFLKTPFTYARLDTDLQPVGWLHGTNASFRRQVVVQAGLWDETVRSQDEHSLAFKLARKLKPGQYLAFRAEPPVLRRVDLGGGMAKRRADVSGELRNQLQFVHRIIGRYYPTRLRALYPLYLTHVLGRTINWIWDEARGETRVARRLKQTAEACLELPREAAAERRVAWR